jgi:hypothetical protein
LEKIKLGGKAMAKVTINCTCGVKHEITMIGGGTYVCKNCGKIYLRRYLGNGKYEIIDIKKEQ